MNEFPPPIRSGGPARLRGDDGLAMALMGLFMVVLLAFVGFAVDIGMLYNERRQEQSAADTAALAAVQDTSWNAQVDTIFRMVNASGDSVYTEADWNDPLNCPTSDMPSGFTTAAQTSFDATADPSRTALIDSDCIASKGTLGSKSYQVWVRVPNTDINTTFAGLVGVNTMRSSAFAVAGFGTYVEESDVMPFAITNMPDGNSAAACLVEPPGGLATSLCPGPDSGNFGTQNNFRPTEDLCGNGDRSESIRNTLAMGMDHIIAAYPYNPALTSPSNVAPDAIQETDNWCDDTPDLEPNALVPNTGANIAVINFINGFLRGPVTFSDGGKGRLTRYPGGPGYPTDEFPSPPVAWPAADFTVKGTAHTALDNAGLWHFIGQTNASGTARTFGGAWATPHLVTKGLPGEQNAAVHTWNLGGTDLPGICNPASGPYSETYDADGVAGGPTVTRSWPWNYDRMVHCLYAIDLSGSTEIVFNKKTIDSTPMPDGKYDIELSPRWGWVPESWRDMNSWVNGASNAWEIKRFRPVFVNDIIFSTGSGDCIWRAGEGRIGSGAVCNSNGIAFRSVTSLLFDVQDNASGSPTMLPAEILEEGPTPLEPYPQLLN